MKDADYTFGTSNEPLAGPDNRLQYRLTARARVVLELEASYPESESLSRTPGRIVVCQIRDLSTNGFCLHSGEALFPGALVPATVVLGAQAESFVLMLEVVWCRPDEKRYLVGVRIIESDETAYVEWAEAVARALSAE